MNKQRTAQLITVLLLAAAIAFTAFRNRAFTDIPLSFLSRATTPKADPTPQDVIYAMLDAARDGQVSAYLSHYAGQMEQSLRKAIAEQGDAAFADYLKQSNATIKGIALQEPQSLTDREVKVRVEYVFADRNEIQFMYLEKTPPSWKITRVDATERIPTLVPYGTPVR